MEGPYLRDTSLRSVTYEAAEARILRLCQDARFFDVIAKSGSGVTGVVFLVRDVWVWCLPAPTPQGGPVSAAACIGCYP